MRGDAGAARNEYTVGVDRGSWREDIQVFAADRWSPFMRIVLGVQRWTMLHAEDKGRHIGWDDDGALIVDRDGAVVMQDCGPGSCIWEPDDPAQLGTPRLPL